MNAALWHPRAVDTQDQTAHQVRLLIGIYADPDRARQALERLIEEDFPMDRVSLLWHAGGLGDDSLGVSYEGAEDRIRTWGRQGLAWGALGGLLAGATGVFMLPGLGLLLAAGPVVELIGGAIAGAAVGGGVMAGAAALTELASALHRMGIAEPELQRIHQAIEQGRHVLVLHTESAEAERWRSLLQWSGAESIAVLPTDP